MSVGSKDEHAVAFVVIPEVASSDANVRPPVPDRGQRRRDRREPPPARASRVLKKHERRAESSDDSLELPPQAGTGTDAHSGTPAGAADVLARRAADEEVAALLVSCTSSPRDAPDVVVADRGRPVALENRSGVGVAVALPCGVADARTFEAEFEPSDPGEDAADSHFTPVHSASSRVPSRAPGRGPSGPGRAASPRTPMQRPYAAAPLP